jgi:NAD(P)-dependent dehydrogenase (short-subunit alcohol dehydrogenase family)
VPPGRDPTPENTAKTAERTGAGSRTGFVTARAFAQAGAAVALEDLNKEAVKATARN